jgi:valyl-tRNA synthetase
MTRTDMPKAYDPRATEPRIYEAWERAQAFSAAPNPEKTPFTIMIPPPNVTGVLHMGHILDNALQDAMIRFRRLRGFEALWQPGTDHAGIATQNAVEKSLRAQGKTRHDLGREAFVELVWTWRQEKGDHILNQLRRLGASCDWSRTRFTMEPDLSAAVTEAFVRLHEKGLVYRGEYIVNWCPRCHTALSDEEVEHTQERSKLWYIRYPLKGEPSAFVTVATTRPETMLGDTAVAIHPTSERTAHLRGKIALLPFLGRELPIIEDAYVEADFGAGALKVTPAHDPNDFEIGKRHGLAMPTMLDEEGKVNEVGGEFAGLDRYEARKVMVARLEEMGLIEKIEENPNAIGRCHRCNTVVEPRLSTQWFVKMKPLAEPALEAYRRGDVRFIPDHWGKTYTHWLDNIRDWVISRQLWWGHRIPVWYCDGCGKEIVARAEPSACPACGGDKLRQDPDVLDTWFSSWLWPFSTLGWPKDTPELKYFYPTNWLTTGPDIIFFWVARMIMAGLEFTGKVPFSEVYLHGIVRDDKGRKMSKSLGNSPEPTDIIEEYGADAVRYTMIALTPVGQDVQFSATKAELGRNFANKIWNASRFLFMNLEDWEPAAGSAVPAAGAATDLADRWILSRLDRVTAETTRAFEENRFSDAAWALYEFFWKEYCDWYLELAKIRLYGEDPAARRRAQDTALAGMRRSLVLLHPLFPFLTEAIWEFLPGAEGLLIRGTWPETAGQLDEDAERRMGLLMSTVTAVRNMRAEMNIAPSVKVRVIARADGDAAAILRDGSGLIETLARAESLDVAAGASKPRHSASAVVEGVEIYLPLEGLIDLDAERARLAKKRDELRKALDGVERKLGNEDFVARAPAEVVKAERERRERFAADLGAVERNLAALCEEG